MIHRQNDDLGTLKEASYLKKKKDEITIRSSAAEYLTYVASVGNQQDSIEMRYEDENIWLTQEMIIAVGFKVNSERAVQFRKWVNQIAKEYTIKGWVMDDERLKRGTYLTDRTSYK